MRKHKHLAVLALSALIFSSAIMTTSCGGNVTEEKQTFKVNVTTGNGYTVDGIKTDGYKEGEKVAFTVTVTDNTKEIDKVTVNNSVLEDKSGTYEFEMPAQDTTIGVLLKDKQGGSTTDPDKPIDPEPVPTEYAISQITTKGETYTIRGQIVANNKYGFLIHDGETAVFANKSTILSEFSIGDFVEITGPVDEYNQMLQFTFKEGTDLDFSIKKVDGNIKEVVAIELTKEIADSFATNAHTIKDIKLYKWTATVGKSGNFYTLNVDGSNTMIEPSFPMEGFELEVGAKYEFEGYFNGYVSKFSYAGIILTNYKKVGEITPEPEPQPSDYSISQITEAEKQYTVRGEVVAKSQKSFVIHDGTTAGYVYGDKLVNTVEIGNLVEVSGRANLYNGILQFAKNKNYTDTTVTVIKGDDIADIPSIPLTKEIADSWTTASSFKGSDVKHYKWTAFCKEETIGSNTYKTLYLDGSDVIINPLYLLDEFGLTANNTYEVEGYFVGYHKDNTSEYACVILTSAKAVENVDAEPTGVTITNGDTAEMFVNNKIQLEYKPTPINVVKKVTRETDNAEIATVDENGLVTAIKVGEVNITAKFNDTIKDTIKITVKDAPALTSLVLTSEKLGLDKNYNTKTEQTNVDGVDLKYAYLLKSSETDKLDAIQMKNSRGKSLIWNASPTQKAIKSIKFEYAAEPNAKSKMKIGFGTSELDTSLSVPEISMLENPVVTCDVKNVTYFRIERFGSNTCYIKSITIEFVE